MDAERIEAVVAQEKERANMQAEDSMSQCRKQQEGLRLIERDLERKKRQMVEERE